MDEFNWDEIVELSNGGDLNLDDVVIDDIDNTESTEEETNQVEETEDQPNEPSVETVQTEETEVEESQETDSYKLLQLMIETGQIEDSVIEIDGNEIQLSEFKDLDKETFVDIIETFKDNKNKDLKDNFINVKDLDETRKALIDIVLKGDLSKVKEVLEDSEEIINDPFQNFDNTNDNHNAQVYYAYLVNQKGNSEDEAKALIDVALNNKTLDLKALKIVEAYKENSKKMLEDKKAKILQEAEERKNKIKEYSKSLDTTFKSYDLRPEKVLEYKKLATQYDNEGNLPIDKIYDDYMSDPSKAADLIMFLTDKELYDKRVFAEAKKTTLKETVNKIQIVKQGKKSKAEEPEDKVVLDGTSFLESIIIE